MITKISLASLNLAQEIFLFYFKYSSSAIPHPTPHNDALKITVYLSFLANDLSISPERTQAIGHEFPIHPFPDINYPYLCLFGLKKRSNLVYWIPFSSLLLQNFLSYPLSLIASLHNISIRIESF